MLILDLDLSLIIARDVFSLYLMGKPSKVVGKWWHMDFFDLTENQVLADFDVKFFFRFPKFLFLWISLGL